jgi:DNA ligase-1
MLAATVKPDQLAKLTFPLAVQPKIDGIRFLVKEGVALSRSLKPLPNLHFQTFIQKYQDYFEGLDGEVVVDHPTAPDVFNKTSSGIMSINGEPDFSCLFFDMWNSGSPFINRVCEIYRVVGEYRGAREYRCDKVFAVPTVYPTSVNDLATTYAEYLKEGYEGAIIRDIDGLYKFGRSTLREGKLIKLKPWLDDEATIIGFEEFMHNENEATISETGHQVRSTHKEGMVPGNKLGAFVVKCDKFPGVEFSVGSGLSMHDRETLWSTRNSLIGKVIKFKYLSIGIKDKPRHPIYLGFRDPRDLDMKLL